jgi:excinuclease UvrABC nuclease subunit
MSKAPAFQRWITFEFNIEPMNLLKSPAVYVVYGDGRLLYIGQSMDVQKRIDSHDIRYGYSNKIHTPWGSYDQVKIKVRYSSKYGDWAMRELRLIKRIQPPFNCVGSVRKRGE